MFGIFWQSLKSVAEYVAGVEACVNESMANAPTDLKYMPHTEAEMQELAAWQAYTEQQVADRRGGR
jgi:hypothetical protein